MRTRGRSRTTRPDASASVTAGVGQYASAPKGNLPIWNVVGLFGVAALALFSVCLLFIDDNAPRELDLARRAIAPGAILSHGI
jgi:hypothetical protein